MLGNELAPRMEYHITIQLAWCCRAVCDCIRFFAWSQRPQLLGLRMASMVICGLGIGLLMAPVLGGIAMLGGLTFGIVLGLIMLHKGNAQPA